MSHHFPPFRSYNIRLHLSWCFVHLNVLPGRRCLAWRLFFIVTLNALTIIIYLRERSLRKRSMYLMIKQAVADLFVGPNVFIACCFLGSICDLWTINLPRSTPPFIVALRTVSPIASLINLGTISLERTHATFRPFKHRLIKKKIFLPMLLLFGLQLGQFQLALSHNLPLNLHFINDHTSYLFCLLTIIVSYSSMSE